MADPTAALEAALGDAMEQVRLGAALSASILAPDAAARLLHARAQSVDPQFNPSESAALALSLAQAGGDALPTVAAAMRTEPLKVSAWLNEGRDAWRRAIQGRVDDGVLERGAARLLVSLYPIQTGGFYLPPGARHWVGTDAALSALKRLTKRSSAQKPERLLAAETALQRGDAEGAAERLVDAATTEPDAWLRFELREALSRLGHLASRRLLALMAGTAVPDQSRAMADSLEDEAGRSLPDWVTPGTLAAFFASETLEAFHDRDTALALTDLAVSDTKESFAGRAARRVLSRMAAETSLPALAWFGTSEAERLLESLTMDPSSVGGLPNLDAGMWKVAPGSLQWLRQLVRQPERHAAWLRDPSVATSVLGAAILTDAEIAGQFSDALSVGSTLRRLEFWRSDVGPSDHRDVGGHFIEVPTPGFDPFTAPDAASGANEAMPDTPSSPAIGVPDRDVFSDPSLTENTLPPVYAGGAPLPAPPQSSATDAGTQKGPLPEARIARHPRCGFPERCRVGEASLLSVRLWPAARNDTSQPFDVPFAAGQATQRLLVYVSASGFAVDGEPKPIEVPRVGPSSIAEFRLVPCTTGKQSIDVKFFAGAALLAHCVVPTEVSEDAGTGRSGGAPTVLLDPLEGEIMEQHGGADAVLFVSTAPDRRLKWTMTRRGGKPDQLGYSRNAIDADQIARWTQLQGQLIQNFQLVDLLPGDIAGAVAQLAGVGSAVFEQIAPASLAAALRSLPDQAVLAVETDADWVPWELLACTANEPLWGNRFVLARLPRITGEVEAKNVQGPASPPEALQRVVLVVGDEVDDAKKMPERLFGDMKARVDRLLDVDWLTLCQSAPSADLLHFACHGRGQPYHLSYGKAATRRLLPSQAPQLKIRHGTVVFANACNSAAPRLLLSEFQSFGRAFYLVGARPFIGTIGPVAMDEATAFAGMFYNAFAQRGLSAGLALRQAREEARKQFRIPIWLFYCLYGNASASRRWSARQ